MRSHMVNGFLRLDDDGNGNVTIEEFARPLTKVISRHDVDDNGKVTKKEIRDHMKNKNKRHHKEGRVTPIGRFLIESRRADIGYPLDFVF